MERIFPLNGTDGLGRQIHQYVMASTSWVIRKIVQLMVHNSYTNEIRGDEEARQKSMREIYGIGIR